IDCGATCSADFDLHSTVTLTASVDGGWSVAGWAGCGSVTATTCTVTVSLAGVAVTATIADRTGPSVTLTAPTAATWQGGTVRLSATASDSVSGISRVEFRVND